MNSGVATVGISNFAQVRRVINASFLYRKRYINYIGCIFMFIIHCSQEALGDVVYCGLPEVGANLSQSGKTIFM